MRHFRCQINPEKIANPNPDLRREATERFQIKRGSSYIRICQGGEGLGSGRILRDGTGRIQRDGTGRKLRLGPGWILGSLRVKVGYWTHRPRSKIRYIFLIVTQIEV